MCDLQQQGVLLINFAAQFKGWLYESLRNSYVCAFKVKKLEFKNN